MNENIYDSEDYEDEKKIEELRKERIKKMVKQVDYFYNLPHIKVVKVIKYLKEFGKQRRNEIIPQLEFTKKNINRIKLSKEDKICLLPENERVKLRGGYYA